MFPQIDLWPGFAVSTYFLTISLATTLSVLWFLRRAEKERLARVTAIDLSLTVLAAGFVGARLLHVTFEDPDFYRANPLAVLKVWNGGFVFLGGAVGALIAGVAFCRIRQEPFWFWADIAAPPAALAYGTGRIACFLNGCCYGRPAEVPWAVEISGALRHPTQLYASAWEFLVLGILLAIQSKLKISGTLFNLWLLLHGTGRILMEAFRDDPRGPQVFDMSLGTLMSAALMSWALFNLVASRLHH